MRAVVWQLGWGLRRASDELRRWRRMAGTIPDPELRADALRAIDGKRGHVDGAALFWSLTGRRNLSLLRTLVACELIYDFLDEVSERGAANGLSNGRLLVRAFADATAPGDERHDYYRCHLASDDGGFLDALVRTSQAGCAELPAFAVVRSLIAQQTARLQVLALNHLPDPVRRDSALKAWAEREFSGERHGLEWWELTAASSQSVVTFALLALAADPQATRAQAEAVHAAYFPWFAHGVTMLDAYVDQEEDARSGAHSYVAHYPSQERMVARLCETVERAAAAQLALPHGERHTVLLACMVAMYLSKDSARAPALRDATAEIVAAGGSLTRLLLPVLRLWRIANGQTRLT